jgi:ribonuclease J
MQRYKNKPVFVLQATTNIDRLVTFYKASNKAKRRAVYVDYKQVRIVKSTGNKHIPQPDIFNNVFEIKPNQSYKDANFTMFVRQSMIERIKTMAEQLEVSGGVLIYSMWQGYKEDKGMQDFLNGMEELGIAVEYLHTSGHASEEDIELLINAISADEYRMVHTEANKTNL